MGYCFPAGGPSSLGSSSQAPPPAPDSCSGAWKQNNNDGVNIDPAPVPNLNTVDQCQDKCESYGGACKGWTLGEGKCYVKSSVGPMRYDNTPLPVATASPQAVRDVRARSYFATFPGPPRPRRTA